MYIQINTEHKTTCTLSFCLVSFQLKHFGERCFSTGVDQICFSFIAEKLPVTAPNGWEPVYRNKAFISLPPKKETQETSHIKVFPSYMTKNSFLKLVMSQVLESLNVSSV